MARVTVRFSTPTVTLAISRVTGCVRWQRVRPRLRLLSLYSRQHITRN